MFLNKTVYNVFFYLVYIIQVRESFEKVYKATRWPALEHYPFAEGVVCLGFFMVYLFEELGERLVGHGQAADRKNRRNNNVSQPAVPGNSVAATSSDLEDDASCSRMAGETANGAVPHSLLDKEQGHGHAHVHGLEHGGKSVTAAIRGFLLVFALSFHSIFEGIT